MDQHQDSGLPASLVNGRLEGLSVPDLLWNLCRRKCTGVLHLTANRITKRVYIESGRIVFALSGDPNDRLGDLLLREGQITLDQLEGAIVQLSSGKRLGTILVAAGHLTPENLVRGVLSQVKGIVLGLFPWEEGEYAFVEGPLPTEEVVTLGMRTAEILLQGIRQIRSFTRIRKSVGPPSTRYRLAADWRTVLDGLDIRDGERMLLQRLDEAGGRGVAVDAMCREIFLSNFEIYQALWALLVLGVVDEVDRAQEPAAVGAIAGRFERTALPSLLVRLAAEEATGVLHMSKGTIERTLHIKAGQCIFATSSAVDDGLVAHLLRRGVISLADREETARRLLSNKRVGTILLEMGVIDESDLRATVREQLSEIVFDTFRWDHGDFQFVEGPLPTIEEITLQRSVEDLIFAGIRRITSWMRVKDGCGGLGARLVLLPEYLSVLDKMTVGPEEWELISVLKTPKTVLEICRESVLGDFRSCQILWALRLLGGVGEAPLEVSLDSALGVFESQPATEGSAPRRPDPEPAAIPLSEADTSAELISEPWRLAEERAPDAAPRVQEDRVQAPVSEAPAFELEMQPDAAPRVQEDRFQAPVSEAPTFELEMQPDATIALSREVVDVILRPEGDGLPKFEIGAPGTGLEDMKVDMPPTSGKTFELASSEDAAAEQEAAERAEAERLEAERAETDRLAAERAEAERLEAERAEAERLEAERLEAERAEAARREAERVETARREAERVEAARREAERVETARREAERAEAARVASERAAAARREFDRLEAERAEAERLAVERTEAARRAAERAEAERLAAEQAHAKVADGDRTVRMSREEIDAALRAPSAPAAEPVLDAMPEPVLEMAEADGAPAWEPPAALDGAIASFNARHVVLFRAMRAEIGAGAANFVRSCRAALDSGFGPMFVAAELRADGSWDPEELKRAIVANRIENAPDGFTMLLDGELHRLRIHMGEKRAAGLADQLAALP